MRDNTLVFGLVALMAMAVSARSVSGQMRYASQGHGHDQGAMQGNTQGNMQGNMPGNMMATAQMMRDVDTMMANAGSMMRDLTAMHAGMGGGPQHDQMMSSMQGMLDQMRQFHGSLNDMMEDPTFGHNSEAMKSFEQAGRDLKQMASALQSMTKNMTKAMKGMTHDPK